MQPSFLKKYLRREAPGMLLGHTSALLLGLVAALITLLIGPSLQLMLTSQSGSVRWSELVSPRLAWLPEMLSGSNEIAAVALFGALPVLLVSVALVKALLGGFQWFVWERLGEKISRAIRQDLMASYVHLSPEARRSPEGSAIDSSIATSMTNDVRMLREYIVHFHGGLPREGLQVLFLGATLVLLSPKLFLAFLIGLVPAALVIRRFGKRLRGRAAKVLVETAELAEWIQQRLLGYETIKHFQTETREYEKLRQLNETLLDRMVRAARLRARTSPLIEAFGIIAIVFILYIALADVRSGQVTGAVLISFFSSIGLFAQSAAKLGKYFNSNKEGMAAVERLEGTAKFLNLHSKSIVGASAGNGMAVVCDDVTISYRGAPAPALNGVSISFKHGCFYGIGGMSGAGKTTLFKAILGLVTPESGSVRVSGDICYMPQGVQLMAAPLIENICYPDQQGDLDRAAAALCEVGIQEFVDRLQEVPLAVSGGQAQRLLLARLVYHDAKVVLVDEGTSALDPELEQVVYRCLRGLAARGACVIMIAHRIPALESADEVVLMEHGKIVEQGTAQFVRQSPAFKRLLTH
jgi:subfamily B ATP-binding cassette protein MsbA